MKKGVREGKKGAPASAPALRPDPLVVLCADGERYRVLGEAELREVNERIWGAVNELTFTAHHLEHDTFDDAQNCLTTALQTLAQLQEELDARRVKGC